MLTIGLEEDSDAISGFRKALGLRVAVLLGEDGDVASSRGVVGRSGFQVDRRYRRRRVHHLGLSTAASPMASPNRGPYAWSACLQAPQTTIHPIG